MALMKKPAAVLGFLTLGLAAFALSGCFGEEYQGPPTPPPVVVSNPCADNDTLCIPRAVLRDTGEVIFQNCSGCHGTEGEGGRGPQLANSDFFMNNRLRVINLVLRGNYGDPPYIDTLVVNGVVWLGGGMPPHRDVLSDLEIAGVLTWLRSVKNDSTVTNCNPDVLDENLMPTCTKTARNPSEMELDTVAVWEVKAVRDTLPPAM